MFSVDMLHLDAYCRRHGIDLLCAHGKSVERVLVLDFLVGKGLSGSTPAETGLSNIPHKLGKLAVCVYNKVSTQLSLLRYTSPAAHLLKLAWPACCDGGAGLV